jgi:alkanesulfonate monooxygenase SsuD/methylene tetrahydromethanopterin reductase-like flavin-dependent oxidoreductase (luciferase family)
MGDNLYADPAAHPSYTLRLEPLTMMAALAVTTSRIGLGRVDDLARISQT